MTYKDKASYDSTPPCTSQLKCIKANYMGWLRLVGSLKLQVSLAKEPYKRDDILQKRRSILRSLLIVATPYRYLCIEDVCHKFIWKRYVYQMSLCVHISVPYTFDIYPLRIWYTYLCIEYVCQICIKQRFDILLIYIETYSIHVPVPYTFDIHTPRICCTLKNLIITYFFFTYLFLFYLPWRPLPHHAGHQKKVYIFI